MTDFDFNMPSMHIRSIEAGARIKILSGVHTGCWELRANDSVSGVADLKGKRVGVWALDDHPQIFLSLIVNYVGLDPIHDIAWAVVPPRCRSSSTARLMRSSPSTTEFPKVHSEKIGHPIASNLVDRPWSQYFCCMVAGSADYVEKYRLATKRVCGLSSNQQISARLTRCRRRARWSIEALCPATTMH